MLLPFCITGCMEMHERGAWELHQGVNYLHWDGVTHTWAYHTIPYWVSVILYV